LEMYYTVTVAAAELATLCSIRRNEAQTPAESVSPALALLHARACQASLEVHALLEACLWTPEAATVISSASTVPHGSQVPPRGRL
jgi:hypothetical protein